jgi:hypothetical protein
MIASTRNLLLKMSFFFRYLSPTGGNAAALITLVLAQIMVRLQRKMSAWGTNGGRWTWQGVFTHPMLSTRACISRPWSS